MAGIANVTRGEAIPRPCHRIAYFPCSEVARRFPALEMLDMEPIPKIAFDVPQASTSHATPVGPTPTTFPVEMGESFIAGVDGAMLSGFLMRYVGRELIRPQPS